jgi:hypothetical protein
VASASSEFWVEPLLDDTTLANLNNDGFYLYQILMTQPDNEALVFNFNNDMFRYDGYVQVFCDRRDRANEGSLAKCLNCSDFLHVRIYLILISLMLRFKYNNDVFICL